MEAGTDRVARAIEDGERITIYGDYDADGTTATALLIRVLQFLSVTADYYIPHRLNEGYGLNCSAITQLAESGTRVLITVDNGITALEQIAHARALGLDVIVTDHHQPMEDLPDALAVIDPSRQDCTYPNKHLTGVGVAFKFAHALLKRMKVSPEKAVPFLRSLLDLVAIGTCADLAPLCDENRILVKFGFDQIAKSTNAGILALKRLLELDASQVTTYKVCFLLAPRLNAAGRTDHAQVCVELLTTQDEARTREIAQRLEVLNRERRKVENAIFEQCLRFMEENIDLDAERVLVINGKDWHLGVIGVVASKFAELFHRPTIIISEIEDSARGSARSINGLSIYEALQACSGHLIAFGGHPAAAGIQLHREDIPAFRKAINECAKRLLQGVDLDRCLTIDTELQSHEIGFPLVQDLGLLEPHGPSNPPPVFSIRNMKLSGQARLVGGSHLKMQLKHGSRIFSAIGFNLGCMASELNESRHALVDAAFMPCINRHFAEPRLELEIKDMKIRTAN